VTVISTPAELQARAKDLYTLGQADGAEAIRRIRELCVEPALARQLRGVQAGLLIDIGSRAKRRDAVEEGVGLMRQLTADLPDSDECRYNLANGLGALADLDLTPWPAWLFATQEQRREARTLLGRVRRAENPNLATQAFTNLGNALDRSYRWSEALDAYMEALSIDPTNGVAAMAAAQMLLRCASRGIGDAKALRRVAMRYAKIARANPERVLQLAGPGGRAALEKLPDGEAAAKPDVSGLKPYLRFVAKHHLALVPTIEGLDPKLQRWDSLMIRSISEPVVTPHGPPPLLAMFNSIKAGFLVVRRLTYRALSVRERQTGRYADTLDYALYGTDVASLLLAQRAAIDVLDQIAVALNDYFGLGVGVKWVDFAKLWREGKTLAWRAGLEAEINAGNSAVVALGELAEDLSAGFLKTKLEARNASTHRFTVLHDEGLGRVRTCEAIEHRDYSAFVDETIATLKAVRAAILYFVETVYLREHRRHRDGHTRLPLYVPAHHHIRRDR
jgi:hypothetical protein